MLPYIDYPFVYVATAIGASSDELKMIFSFLLSYPLAGVLKRIPDSKPWQKNVYIIGVSLFYLVGLFDLWSGLTTLAFSATGAYLIAAFVKGPMMPWIGFVFLMGHMSVSHIYRQAVNDPGTVDVSGAQMVLVMKMTAFCWNVYDGQFPDSELSDFQKERAIRELPSILDFAAYVLFFPALLAGPAFDFSDYRNWINTQMFEAPPGMDPAKLPPTRKKRKIPRSATPAIWKAVAGLVWILAFLQLSGRYSAEFILGPEYLKYGFLRRIWLLHMFAFTARTKYYGVWALAEGSCILAGIGYRGVDPVTGRAKWDRLENVRPFALETAQNTHALISNWNINTSHWLRNYVYLRVTPKGQKPGYRATLATFVTSAFWHGFYPGYYMMFVLASTFQHFGKTGRRLFRPFFMTPDGSKGTPYKIYYDVVTTLAAQLSLSFAAAPFILLTFSDSMKVWKANYFFVFFGLVAFQGFLSSPARGNLVKMLKKRNGNVAPGMKRTESTDSMRAPALGVPDDPERDMNAIVDEVKREMDARKIQGFRVTPADVHKAVQSKINTVKVQ